ncbi:hypothetical protein J4526_06750 [Desulfurococcaceae archaeon MEX13E-LK6-19]|nr:hypothetical protein J4526_06750 [Desulfurococcaceae archaeon MEX13E-LK6-19]
MFRNSVVFFPVSLVLILFISFSYGVYADSTFNVDVVVEGNTYRNVKIVCNTSILSVGKIPNGLRIIVNETPAKIVLYLNGDLHVGYVRGDVLYYNVVTTDTGASALEIFVSKTSGLAEVEIVFRSPSWFPRISLMTFMEIAFIALIILVIAIVIRRK